MAFAPTRKPHWIGCPVTHKNGDFGALSVTGRSCAAPIECFHSRGQNLCKFIGTKESVCITKKVQLPKDWFRTPTWPPFHGFGTPVWPP